MPLVLTENEATESGITYRDRTGVSYQYPPMYRRMIRTGERFVYYKGRKTRSGGRTQQVYFGTGVVGAIADDPEHPGRLKCDVLDYRPFPTPLAFKDAAGTYFEAGGARRGYFQRGARVVSEDEFSRILNAANAVQAPEARDPEQVVSAGPSYASPELLRAVEAFAVQAALKELGLRFPDATPKVQPRNNPGFDVLVPLALSQLYVEVKGTQRALPQFFMTEGEVQFSRRHAEQFRLLVIYRIDLKAGTYESKWHEGAVSLETGVLIRPVQWSCQFETVATPSEHDK